MNRQQEIRHECLFQLYGSQRIPLSAAHIRKVAMADLRDYTSSEVLDALFFLHGQGFCTKLSDPATGVVRYQITSAGSLHWEQRSE
jgi:hypothetical protein